MKQKDVKHLTLYASLGELFIGVPLVIMILTGAWGHAFAWYVFWTIVNWLLDGAIYPIE